MLDVSANAGAASAMPSISTTGPSQDTASNGQRATQMPRRHNGSFVPSDLWQITTIRQFDEMVQPREVAIYYANGKRSIKIDRMRLCMSSEFFNKAFNGPFSESQTDSIRLRNDFPFAVEAMVMFLKEGYYSFNINAYVIYPNLTMLDVHAHAYIVATKYHIPTLAQHAVREYINIAVRILRTYWAACSENNPAFRPRSAWQLYRSRIDSATAEVEQFLNSISLIWKNTPGSPDMMRFAVLQLIEPVFSRLARLKLFTALCLCLPGFGEDLRFFFEYMGLDFNIVETSLSTENDVRFCNAYNRKRGGV